MTGTAKSKGAAALDDVKTQRKVGATLDANAAGAKEREAAQRQGDAAHDSPKRQGDKLEKARDAAAGRKP